MICKVIEPLKPFLVEIDTLSFDPKNARKHGERNLDSIKQSLRQFGQRVPLVVQKDGLIVRAGNGRLEAARGLGWTHIAAVVVDENDVDAVAYSITDNRTGDLAEWNIDVLSDLVEDLVSEDFNIQPLGWDQDELDDMLKVGAFDQSIDVNEIDLSTIQEIDPPEPQLEEDEVVVTKPGDILILGAHRVLCGDCRDSKNWDRLLGARVVDMCFTDPPYNIGYSNQGFHTNPLLANAGITSSNERKRMALDKEYREEQFKAGRFTKRSIQNDVLDPSEFRQSMLQLSKHLKKRVVGDCYIWTTFKKAGAELLLYLIEGGFHHGNTIVWRKNTHVLSPSNYQRKHEFCHYGWYGKKSSWHGDRKQTDVWDFDRPNRNEFHPTMKPINLCSLRIRNSSAKGQTVLDPYLGSGSTLLACEQLDRICFGFELEPKYCDVIANRWEQLTNRKIERVSNVV